MRHDEAIPAVGPEPDRIGRVRRRVGRSWSRPWTRCRVLWLLAAAIGLPWLPTPGARPRDLPVHRARGHPGVEIRGFAISTDGQTIATVDDRGRVRLRPAVDGGGIERTLDDHGQLVAFSPDGHRLAISGDEPDVLLCDLDRAGRGRPLGIPVRASSGLRFSPDGRTLAVSSFGSGEIILWDIEMGRERMRLRGHSAGVLTLAFAPDGRSLSSGSATAPEVIIWDLATGRPRHRLDLSGARTVALAYSPTVALAYSPDARRLATVNAFERPIRIWDVRTGDQLRLIAGQSRPSSFSVAFSPDGRLLATAGDGTASLWSVATGRELRRVDGQADRLSHVAFSPDGRTLVATGNDDDIRFWDLDSLIAEQVEPHTDDAE
jgi:WD40 repeat protein